MVGGGGAGVRVAGYAGGGGGGKTAMRPSCCVRSVQYGETILVECESSPAYCRRSTSDGNLLTRDCTAHLYYCPHYHPSLARVSRVSQCADQHHVLQLPLAALHLHPVPHNHLDPGTFCSACSQSSHGQHLLLLQIFSPCCTACRLSVLCWQPCWPSRAPRTCCLTSPSACPAGLGRAHKARPSVFY